MNWEIIRLNDKTYRLVNHSEALLTLGFFNEYMQEDELFIESLKTKESKEQMYNRYKIAKTFKQI